MSPGIWAPGTPASGSFSMYATQTTSPCRGPGAGPMGRRFCKEELLDAGWLSGGNLWAACLLLYSSLCVYSSVNFLSSRIPFPYSFSFLPFGPIPDKTYPLNFLNNTVYLSRASSVSDFQDGLLTYYSRTRLFHRQKGLFSILSSVEIDNRTFYPVSFYPINFPSTA